MEDASDLLTEDQHLGKPGHECGAREGPLQGTVCCSQAYGAAGLLGIAPGL